MGIFDKVNTDSDSKDEVVINMSEEKSEKRITDSGSSSSSGSAGKLRDEVETSLTSSRSGSTSKVTLEDIHKQNERIISLLESLTDTEDEDDDQEMVGGLNGVL